jgi:hypothetical protein
MYQVNIRHGLFAVCGHDFVSRFTTLSNITIKILSLLFWVSLGSILRSVIASLALSLYSKIDLSSSFMAHTFLFIFQYTEDFGHKCPEPWIPRTLVWVENFSRLVV